MTTVEAFLLRIETINGNTYEIIETIELQKSERMQKIFANQDYSKDGVLSLVNPCEWPVLFNWQPIDCCIFKSEHERDMQFAESFPASHLMWDTGTKKVYRVNEVTIEKPSASLLYEANSRALKYVGSGKEGFFGVGNGTDSSMFSYRYHCIYYPESNQVLMHDTFNTTNSRSKYGVITAYFTVSKWNEF